MVHKYSTGSDLRTKSFICRRVALINEV